MPDMEKITAKVRYDHEGRTMKVHAIVKVVGPMTGVSAKERKALQKICDGMGPQVERVLKGEPAKASGRGGGSNAS